MPDQASAQVLPLSGDRARALRWLAVFLFGIPGVLLAILFANALHHGVPLWLAGSALLGPLLLLQVLYMWISARINRAGVALNAQAIGIDAGFNHRVIALERLAPRGVQEIDLRERIDLRPLLHVFAIALPGFNGGFFTLRDGRKALCLVTDRSRVCMLEDDDGMIYLLSLDDVAPLRKALQRTAQ